MLSEVRVLGSRAGARRAILERVDRLTRSQLEHTDLTAASQILSTARFSPHLPLVIAGTEMPDGAYAPDRTIGRALPYLAAVEHMARDHLGDAPIGSELAVGLEIDDGIPRFVAWIRNSEEEATPVSAPPARPPPPVGQAPVTVARWFALVSSQPVPAHDGKLHTARQAVDAYVQRSKAANTLRGYRAAVRAWCQWANTHDLPALPARSEDVAAYLADMALRKRRTSTIDLHRAALRYLHHLAQVAVPTSHPLVSATLAGIRREDDDPAPRQKTALTWDRLTEAVDAIQGQDPVAVRDRAIPLLGFAGAFRRSELAGLEVSDIVTDNDGMRIRLRRSKGDPAAKGVLIGIPRGITRNCPVRAYEAWIKTAGIEAGPVFRRIWLAPVSRPGEPLHRRRSVLSRSPTVLSRTLSASDVVRQVWKESSPVIVFDAAQSAPAQRTGMTCWN